MKLEESFVRHQPWSDRIVFALILDRKKMKERIMAGEASQIFHGLNGNMDAELLCDVARPLGTFLIDFENDMQGDWNRFGIMPLYDLLYKNECQSWRNKIKRAERTKGFFADRLLKMHEAFETFKKAALQKKRLVKEHKMLPQEFMDWLYQQSSVIMELVESRSEQ